MVAPPIEPPLSWSLAHGVRAAFTAASDGDCRDADQRRAALARLGVSRTCLVPRQVHGCEVIPVAADAQPGAVDGLVSDHLIALGVYGADCPGVVLITPGVLGVAHCGWRGTAAGIVDQLVAQVQRLETRVARAQWQAFIGPGIAGRDYEVDLPVLSARAWPPAALSPRGPQHASLDLAEAITCDLRRLGVERVERCGVNTYRDPRLHSYRRSGEGPVQLLVAWRS